MARVQPTRVLTGPVVVAAVVFALLAVLDRALGLGAVGWAGGLACGFGMAALLDGASVRHGIRSLGPASRVTATRAVLAVGVAALTAHSFVGDDHVAVVVTMAAVALSLDAVDGRVARRTGTATALGARFDMETDAFLIAVLSAYVAPAVGWWVLGIGAIRYAYVAASWWLRWLRRPLPPRASAKVVAALQGIVLTVAAAELLPTVVSRIVLAAALVLLVESFARDVRRLWRERREPLPTSHEPTPEGPLVRPAVVTVASYLALWAALVLPDPLDGVTPAELLAIPLEGLVLVAVALVLPARTRRGVALLFGLAAGVLVVLHIVNRGFGQILDRPFDLLGDWGYFGSAVGVLGDSIGDVAARLAAVGAVLLIVVVLVGLAVAADRATRVAADRRGRSATAVGALATAWIVLAVAGVHTPGGGPIAAAGASDLVTDTVDRVRAGLADRDDFADEIADDDFADVPADRLLAGLRGKDVLLVYVESYGRTATRGSSYSPGIQDVLVEGTERLDAAGYETRSAYLTSPTFGAASWWAHSTTQSGLWIDSEGRYQQLLESDRISLTSAFGDAGWRTVFTVPANTRDWPEGAAYYGFDQIYDSRNTGYAGPQFGYAPQPDQYTLSHFWRAELAPTDRAPVFGEIDLISGHHPWTPSPPLVPWDEVGDGSVFHGTTEDVAEVHEQDDPDRVKELYGRSIEYSWEALVSFLETYPDPDRVLVVLGDHEPHAYVSGDPDKEGGHDVPVTVIAQDPDVMQRIADWDWSPGLLPPADAPVWPMSEVRDQLFIAFGSR